MVSFTCVTGTNLKGGRHCAALLLSLLLCSTYCIEIVRGARSRNSTTSIQVVTGGTTGLRLAFLAFYFLCKAATVVIERKHGSVRLFWNCFVPKEGSGRSLPWLSFSNLHPEGQRSLRTLGRMVYNARYRTVIHWWCE